MAESFSKIAVLIPYYGKWPAYFPFFLNSCKRNSNLHYFLVSDLLLPETAPPNVFRVELSFHELKQKIRDRLAIEPGDIEPYKLCDYKPAYGVIFEEIIENYEWWGFGDIDIILGKLSNFVTVEDLRMLDIISFRDSWVSGSLTLLRNTDGTKNLFREIRDINQLLTNVQYKAIDEVSFEFNKVREMPALEIAWPYENFTLAVARRSKNLRTRFKTVIKEHLHSNERIEVKNDGSIIDHNGREFCYYHLVNEKKNFFFSAGGWRAIPDSYYFYSFGPYRRRLNVNQVLLQLLARKTLKVHKLLARKFSAAWGRFSKLILKAH